MRCGLLCCNAIVKCEHKFGILKIYITEVEIWASEEKKPGVEGDITSTEWDGSASQHETQKKAYK